MRKYLTIPKRKQKEDRADAPAELLQCSRCKAIFSNYLTICPECGSEDWISYTELNPYSRMPLEVVLQICGHIFWIGGTVFFLLLLWQTSTTDAEENRWFIYVGCLSLALGILFSALYFGLSEIIMRILRLQRRLKAFHENYRGSEQIPSALPKSMRKKTLIQYGVVLRPSVYKKRKKLLAKKKEVPTRTSKIL